MRFHLLPLALFVLVPALLRAGSPADSRFPPAAQLPSHAGLPDPLVMLDGRRVTTREQWEKERRPELKALFQYYMYGYLPAPTRTTALPGPGAPLQGGKATLKQVTLSFGPPQRIHLLLVLPRDRHGPVPVFVGMNFCGNHALVPRDVPVALPTAWMYSGYPGVVNHRATDDGRGTQMNVWPLAQIVARGYAVATFYNGDVDPDRPDVREGIQPYFAREGLMKPGPHAWGTIAAWAYGIHRAVDYLATDPDIDRGRIIVVGHSRLGKTALLAAAFDERIALAIPLQAGCGGTAPSRGTVGESVKQINDHFPHWFDGAFKAFNDHPDRLPFDQNGLVALVAPRPVLFANATQDTWANPAGQFEVLKAADPVYRFLGVDGLGSSHLPPTGKLLDSRLGYFIRPGQHSMQPIDWNAFCDFADKQLGKPK